MLKRINMKNTLYKFFQIAQVNFDELESEKEYAFEFKNGTVSSTSGKVLKHIDLDKIKSVLLPVDFKFITDAEINKHWKRNNCTGHYLEGLENGAKWMRDEMFVPYKKMTEKEFLQEWKNKM